MTHRPRFELPLLLFLFFLCLEPGLTLLTLTARDRLPRKLEVRLGKWFTRLWSRRRRISFLSLSLLGSTSLALFLQASRDSLTRKLKVGDSRRLRRLDRRLQWCGLRVGQLSACSLWFQIWHIVRVVLLLVSKYQRG